MKSQRPDLLENIIEPYWRVAIPISISHVCRRYANVGTRIDQFSISGGRSTCDPAQKNDTVYEADADSIGSPTR